MLNVARAGTLIRSPAILDLEPLSGLQAVGQSSQLGDEIGGRVDLLDVSILLHGEPLGW